MLQSDAPAVVQERLKVLIVVVQAVLVSEQHLDNFAVGRVRLLHLVDIRKPPETARNVAGGQRIAFERRHNADHVPKCAILVAGLWLDSYQIELLRAQAECLGCESSHLSGSRAELRRNRQTVHLTFRDDEKTNRMNRSKRPRREYGALDALLPAARDKGTKAREISERLLVNGRFRANRQRGAHLGDDDSDFSRRNLDPRKLFDFIKQPRLPAQSGHQEIGLITRFTVECNGVVLCQLSQRNALQNQADFRRSHAADGHQWVENSKKNSEKDPGRNRHAQ